MFENYAKCEAILSSLEREYRREGAQYNNVVFTCAYQSAKILLLDSCHSYLIMMQHMLKMMKHIGEHMLTVEYSQLHGHAHTAT